MGVNVSGPGGSAGLDPQALKILAEPLIEGAAAPSHARNAAPAPATDRVSVSLPELAASAPLQQLIQSVESRLFPAPTGHGGGSHHGMIQSYNFATQSLSNDVDSMTLSQAKDSALKALAKAAHSIELGGPEGPRIPDNLDPNSVLALATQMIATAQYANYLRAGELGNEIASWYDGPLTAGPAFRRAQAGTGGGELELSFGWLQSIVKFWRRAPLLVLLASWLGAGAATALMWKSPSFFNVWGIGFLALIVVQFVFTIRGALRRKRHSGW